MTPEELRKIAERERPSESAMVRELVEEVRRLWAERDARAIAGGPVSEKRLAEIRKYDSELTNPVMIPHTMLRDLVKQVAFLEQLLLDGDDLPAVRRTGYADGWRAGLEAWVKLMRAGGGSAGVRTWSEIIDSAHKLAEEVRGGRD